MQSQLYCRSPLCVYCLSPQFSIALRRPKPLSAASRRFLVYNRRRGDSFLPSSAVRRRFKPIRRRSSIIFSNNRIGFNHCKGTLNIQEVLNEIQKAWGLPEHSPSNMEKSGQNSELLSPILLRRRLSAPEIVMRKHSLAQQRADSQDSDCLTSSKPSLRTDHQSGSDSDLNRKRDLDQMRKSTLLRRFWNHSKPLTSPFYEWQQSYRKLSTTHSLTSIQSSPEHLVSQNKRSPHKPVLRMSPKRPKDRTTSSNYEDYTSFSDSTITTTKNSTITETRCTNTSYTTFSDNSDSAYTNTNYSEGSNNNSEYKQFPADPEDKNQDHITNNTTTTENNNETTTTNVNVISNVHLSQSTLDLIFNQVMQDVKVPNNSDSVQQPEIHPDVVHVQQIPMPSFFLNENVNRVRPIDTTISNIAIGSYTKSSLELQNVVPRFSARPESSSMEVNMSSGDSDKESDTISLVDSLEDTLTQTDIKLVKSDISLELPDNSAKPSKSTSFFIPIELDKLPEFKPVSEHLPETVKNRLLKRQQKREEKSKNKNSSRSDSNYLSASDNGNYMHQFFDTSSDFNFNITPDFTCKTRNRKPLLPSIETLRKIKINKSPEPKFKSYPTKSRWASKSLNKSEKLSPLVSSKNEYVYDYGANRRIYHKTECNNSEKRIEILEIMECLDSPTGGKVTKKSKIPVLVNQKLPKIGEGSQEKSGFLNSNPIKDPKLDQLIANILIDTLNIPDSTTDLNDNSGEKGNVRHSPLKYQQKFEAIPEELPLQSSAEDFSNNNEKNEHTSYQGKAAVAVIKDENFASVPKGWITFYMLHKNRGSPDSTSDEGKKLESAIKPCQKVDLDKIKAGIYDSNDNYCSSSSEIQTKSALPATHKSYKKYSHHRKSRYKGNPETEKNKLGDWSITVSGSNNYTQCAPNLEMCLKFPEIQKNINYLNSQSDSGLGEDNERIQFPKIKSKLNKLYIREESDDSLIPHLPEIGRNVALTKRRANSGLPGRYRSALTEPRQNRTSTKRYNLTRPKIDFPHEITDTTNSMSTNAISDRQYAELLRRLPEILTITGNTVRQNKKRD